MIGYNFVEQLLQPRTTCIDPCQWILTVPLLSSYDFWIMVVIFLGIPYCSRILHSAGLWTQSKALRKWTKFTVTSRCHSATFSIICLSKKIWYVHDLRGPNPVKQLINSFLLTIQQHSSRNFAWSQQLVHSVKLPFFGSAMMISFFQLTAVTLCCRSLSDTILWCLQSLRARVDAVYPAAFPFYSCLTADLSYTQRWHLYLLVVDVCTSLCTVAVVCHCRFQTIEHGMEVFLPLIHQIVMCSGKFSICHLHSLTCKLFDNAVQCLVVSFRCCLCGSPASESYHCWLCFGHFLLTSCLLVCIVALSQQAALALTIPVSDCAPWSFSFHQ